MRCSARCFAISSLLALTILPACAQSSTSQNSKPAAQAAAELPLVDLSGYNKLLAKYRGKPLLVTFWATWCEPCRYEFPELVSLAKLYVPMGLSVFGVSLDNNADMNL